MGSPRDSSKWRRRRCEASAGSCRAHAKGAVRGSAHSGRVETGLCFSNNEAFKGKTSFFSPSLFVAIFSLSIGDAWSIYSFLESLLRGKGKLSSNESPKLF